MVAATENAVALTGLSVTTTGFFVSGGGDRPAGTNRCARGYFIINGFFWKSRVALYRTLTDFLQDQNA